MDQVLGDAINRLDEKGILKNDTPVYFDAYR